MRKNLLIAAAILSATLMVGCGGGNKKNATDQQTEQHKPLVKVEQSVQQQVAQTVDFTANLKGNKEMSIIPMIPSERIDKIYVEVGDKVEEGQLLVELSHFNYNQYKVQLDFARQSIDRMQPAFEIGGISQQQMDELTSNITNLEEAVQTYEDNIWFRSPISGYVTMRNFEEGDLFVMASGMPILQVMDIDRLKAYVGVSEQYFNQVYMNMPVEVTTDIYPGETFTGKVSRITPAISAATRTFEVEILIPNASKRLRPGMFARTTFNMGESTGITVLDVAIQRQAGTNDKYVFVIEDGVAIRKPIVTGRQNGDRVEVVSGLKVGETVAIAGMSRLSNGVQVEIIEN